MFISIYMPTKEQWAFCKTTFKRKIVIKHCSRILLNTKPYKRVSVNTQIRSNFNLKMFKILVNSVLGLPGWLSGKESTCHAGDAGDANSIPGLGRSPGGGHGNLLQYSCLENPVDGRTWWATVPGVTESWTWWKRLSMHARKHSFLIL